MCIVPAPRVPNLRRTDTPIHRYPPSPGYRRIGAAPISLQPRISAYRRRTDIPPAPDIGVSAPRRYPPSPGYRRIGAAPISPQPRISAYRRRTDIPPAPDIGVSAPHRYPSSPGYRRIGAAPISPQPRISAYRRRTDIPPAPDIGVSAPHRYPPSPGYRRIGAAPISPQPRISAYRRRTDISIFSAPEYRRASAVEMDFEDLEGHDSAVNSSEGCEHPGSTLGLFITIFKIPYVRRIKKTQKRILPPCEGGVQSYGCVRSVLKVLSMMALHEVHVRQKDIPLSAPMFGL